MHPILQHTRRLHNSNNIFGYVIQAHIELFLPLLYALHLECHELHRLSCNEEHAIALYP